MYICAAILLTSQQIIPYSRKFSLVRKCVQTLQKKFSRFFIFIFAECDALTTPLSVDGHIPHTTTLNDKANKQLV